jgi:hypothetical protein
MFGLDNKESAAIFMINIKFLFYRLIFTPVIGMLSFDFDVIGDSCFVFCKSYTYANSRGGFRGGMHPARAKDHIFPILGGAREIFGVFHVKNHDFTPKKIIFLPILGGARAGCIPPLNPPLLFA